MVVIPLNMSNAIRRRLFQDDIEVVAVGPNAEEPNVLGVCWVISITVGVNVQVYTTSNILMSI